MAITLADFNKIWSSTSPLSPYTFSDDNYNEGWNFIGQIPPSRQMWDFLQKNNDEKMQYLANNYLPLSGGTMTGEIHRNGSLALCKTNDTFIRMDGGSAIGNGGAIILYGKDSSSYTGCFRVVANDAVNPFQELLGKPDGTLTWNNKEVERVNAKDTDYIRLESGLQVCWGTTEITCTNAGTTAFPYVGNETLDFPVAFISVPIAFANVYDNPAFWNAEVRNITTTNCIVYVAGNNDSTVEKVSYVAIGWWK